MRSRSDFQVQLYNLICNLFGRINWIFRIRDESILFSSSSPALVLGIFSFVFCSELWPITSRVKFVSCYVLCSFIPGPTYINRRGYIDVGEGCWRQNVLLTTIRCWCHQHGDGFDNFGRQLPLCFYISVWHQHSKDVINMTVTIVGIDGHRQSKMQNHRSDLNFVNRLFWTWYKVDFND